MSESESEARQPTSRDSRYEWRLRLNLYQTLMLFSIAVVCLALYNIESRLSTLQAARSLQIMINRELVVDDPTQVSGILTRPELSETRWCVYIPPTTIGQLMLDGRSIAQIQPGMHDIVIDHDRADFMSFRYDLLVDGVRILNDFNWNPGQVALRETTEVAVGQKLPLSFKESFDVPTREILLWIEARPGK